MLLVSGIYLRIHVEYSPQDFFVAGNGGGVNQSEAQFVTDRRIRSFLEQVSQGFRFSAGGGEKQGRSSPTVTLVDLKTLSQQFFQAL